MTGRDMPNPHPRPSMTPRDAWSDLPMGVPARRQGRMMRANPAGMVAGVHRGLVRIDWLRVILLTAAGVVFLWGCDRLYLGTTAYAPGGDFALYQDAAHRWLTGGGLYQPYQLAGPYDTLTHTLAPILYPPMALLLFVPSLVLPGFLWWLIPLGGTLAIVLAYRPRPLAWLVMAACFTFIPTIDTIGAGNPGMWVPLAVALGLRYRWPAALVLLKPSLFPLALIGIRDRRWWIAAGLLAAVSLLMLPMDLDWIRAMLNAQGSRSGLLYSLRELPMDLIPIVAWAGYVKRTQSKTASIVIAE